MTVGRLGDAAEPGPVTHVFCRDVWEEQSVTAPVGALPARGCGSVVMGRGGPARALPCLPGRPAGSNTPVCKPAQQSRSVCGSGAYCVPLGKSSPWAYLYPF